MSHGPVKPGPFGVIAEFETPDQLLAAANKALDSGYSRMDGFTPFPVHGMPDAIGFQDVRVKWVIFFAGLCGVVGGFGLEFWVSSQAYVLNIGGKPTNPMASWPAFIPPAYECMILAAALGAVFGMIAMNKLPQPYHPVFDAPNFERASQDRFFLLIEAKDPMYDAGAITKLMESQNAVNVTELGQEEENDW